MNGQEYCISPSGNSSSVCMYRLPLLGVRTVYTYETGPDARKDTRVESYLVVAKVQYKVRIYGAYAGKRATERRKWNDCQSRVDSNLQYTLYYSKNSAVVALVREYVLSRWIYTYRAGLFVPDLQACWFLKIFTRTECTFSHSRHESHCDDRRTADGNSSDQWRLYSRTYCYVYTTVTGVAAEWCLLPSDSCWSCHRTALMLVTPCHHHHPSAASSLLYPKTQPATTQEITETNHGRSGSRIDGRAGCGPQGGLCNVRYQRRRYVFSLRSIRAFRREFCNDG